MKIPYYQVDAFTSSVFSGNPAGVCLLDKWPNDSILQSIATENNLSETAFIVKNEKGYDIRWFTPKIEVDLCGHATLASAFVVFKYVDSSLVSVQFESKSGLLIVNRENDGNKFFFHYPYCRVCEHSSRSIILIIKSSDYLFMVHNVK